MPPTRFFPTAAIVCAVLGGALLFGPPGDAPREATVDAPVIDAAPRPLQSRSAADADRTPRADIATDPQTGELVRVDLRRFAGRRRSVVVEATTRGIRCPDGTHLPLLNDVEAAPAIIRAEEHGPLPPVVAIVVDVAGFEWYEHADGSMTTSRPQFVTTRNGQREIQVITVHTADRLPGDAVRPIAVSGMDPDHEPDSK